MTGSASSRQHRDDDGARVGRVSEPDYRTIGVAIGLPEPFHHELRERRAAAGDPQAAVVPPHVTLLPPTEVEVAALFDVEEHLRRVSAAHLPFELHLAGPGTFRPVSPVVFVQVSAGISQCELIEADVRSGPLFRETNFPYHPHVTVAQNVPTAQLDAAYDGLSGFEARFGVSGFTMFEQDGGDRWRRRREFPLDGSREG
jgi:2'-5' RNA ligase